MQRLKLLVLLLTVTGLVLVGCRETTGEQNATLAPTVGVTRPAERDGDQASATYAPDEPPSQTENADPAATAPIATPASQSAPAGDEDDVAIEAAVEEINNDLCREAHEARAELAALLAQGEDVADLEQAVVELIEELENCPPDGPPAP